jgi:hypothetical protein
MTDTPMTSLPSPGDETPALQREIEAMAVRAFPESPDRTERALRLAKAVADHIMLALTQAAESRLAVVEQRLKDAEADGWCDACAGTGKPADPTVPCMCGGSGKAAMAVIYLRERLFALQDEREAEKERLALVKQEHARLRAQEQHACEYLGRLLLSRAPQCEPLPDLLGLCTQIDNLLTGTVVVASSGWTAREPSIVGERWEDVDVGHGVLYGRCPRCGTARICEWCPPPCNTQSARYAIRRIADLTDPRLTTEQKTRRWNTSHAAPKLRRGSSAAKGRT